MRLRAAFALCSFVVLTLVSGQSLHAQERETRTHEQEPNPNEEMHEGDTREREAFFYQRVTSGDLKDPAEIQRRAFAGYSTTTRAGAFRAEQVPTWSQYGTSLGQYQSGRVRSMAFDPSNANRLYIAASVGGLWVNDDITSANPHWTCLSDNMPTSVTTAIAISPNAPGTIYVGTGESYPGYVASIGMGVFKSTDHGLNWKSILPEATMGTTTTKIAVDPTNANNVFVAAPGDFLTLLKGTTPTLHGLFHSVDGGATWVKASLPASVIPIEVVIDSSNPQRVYAMGFYGEFYRSTNGGTSWSRVSLPYSSSPGNPMLAIATSTPNVLYVSASYQQFWYWEGLYQSTDYGATWSQVNSSVSGNDMLSGQGFYGHALAVDPSDANTLYIGGLDVNGSTDGGQSFSPWSNSRDSVGTITFCHADIHCLIVRGGQIFAGCDGGLGIYTNGTGWSTSINQGLPTLQFVGLDATSDMSRVIGGTQDNGTNSIDAGQPRWTPRHGGDGGNVWISQFDPDIALGTYINTYIFRSSDGGVTWSDDNFQNGSLVTNQSLLNESSPFYSAYDASSDGQIIAFGGNQRVYVSMDGGTDGFAQGSSTTVGISYSMLVSPFDSRHIWAGGQNAIWRSATTGATFARVATPVTGSVVGIAQGKDVNTLYAVIGGLTSDSNGHFVASTDGGVSWHKVATNFPSIPANSIVRASSGQLFVGTDYGVITSYDSGVTWSHYGVGLPLVQVLSMKVRGTSPQVLLIGTHGRGAWTIPIVPLGVSERLQAAFSLDEVSPNPIGAASNAKLSFSLDRSSSISLTIFDGLGRTVKVVARQNFDAGHHEVTLATTDLTAGEYFLALTSQGSTLAKKFVVLR